MTKRKENSKSKAKRSEEAKLLELLKKVLPKAAPDAALADAIYRACEAELQSKARVSSFQKFCDRVELPDLEVKTLEDVKTQFSAAFGEGDVTIQADRKEKQLEVEVSLPDGTQLQSRIPVRAVPPGDDGDPEVALKFIAFPVAMPGDPELTWSLARHENLSADEAGIALAKAEEEFWASKTGQKLQRDRVEKSFPEFISRAPSGMLTNLGLKRHYKLPEPVFVTRAVMARKK